MKFWPFSRRRDEVKYSAAGPIIAAPFVGLPQWTPRDYEALARESYLYNPIAYRCVKLIAASAATAPWLLYRKSAEIEAHPILDLLDKPAPMTSRAAFLEAVYAYLLLAGNSYVEGVGPSDGTIKELWPLRPDRMQVIPGPYALPQGYRYVVNGRERGWQADPLTGFGAILHLKEFHPVHDLYGLSRVEPSAFATDQHNAASAHNKALLDNGARPSGALVFEPVKMANGDAVAAPDGAIAKAEKDLAGRIGASNAGKPFVFGGNVRWEEMGVSPKDMDFANVKADAARDICTAFGVPHILIVPGAATYNNVREAKLELWEETILPMTEYFRDHLNMWLCPRYGDGLRLDVDRDGISALEPRRKDRRDSVVQLLDKGVIDEEEAREALQYGPRLPNVVKKVDAAVLRVLIDAVDIAGFEPLARYMKSVGLYDPSLSTDEIIAMATDHLAGMDAEAEAAMLASSAPADDPAPTEPPVQENTDAQSGA